MTIRVAMRPDRGFLAGPKQVSFTCFDEVMCDVIIEQCAARIITISSSEGTFEQLVKVYYTISSLLMLFDGQFLVIESAYAEDADITQSWKECALACYESADFMCGSMNSLIDFTTVVNSKLYKRWNELREHLDIIHNMVLYCLSSVQMPKDMQCSFMIEAFEGLAGLVAKRKPQIAFEKAKKQESQLKINLLTFMRNYGAILFQDELNNNANEFAQILVNSRNRISHISSKHDRAYLNGEESVIYLMKLSLLYRLILFDLLEVDSTKYERKLRMQAKSINSYDVTRDFLKKLGESNG